eukprot:TRINITY_DN9654_c0_g1_i1.p1 TRINITY_DN9654_c0_g1~~TRINITY_DN9654_c0_g1_i1.p1  ORF type:complete len:391 (+),score=68.80 TRINITY_DN9654_c0_g1_i1:161-1333(+)
MWLRLATFAIAAETASVGTGQQQNVEVSSGGQAILAGAGGRQPPALLQRPVSTPNYQPAAAPVQVRFTLLQPTSDIKSLLNVQVLFLRNALCWAERHLSSALMRHPSFAAPPIYVIYTDNHTHRHAEEAVGVFDVGRYKIINLDMDPADRLRMAPFTASEYDDKNLASIRRTLADADHLSVGASRLLLGTDIKFLREPLSFVEAAARLHEKQAMYMVDRLWAGPGSNVLYKLNYAGPQCPGLLGDFIYLSPGTEVSVSNLQAKMLWYRGLPKSSQRHIPPCPEACSLSNGLHAIDQFGMALALGEAVVPIGQGCFAMDADLYSHFGRTLLTQIVHDKEMDSCVLDAPIASHVLNPCAQDPFMYSGILLFLVVLMLAFVFVAFAFVSYSKQ